MDPRYKDWSKLSLKGGGVNHDRNFHVKYRKKYLSPYVLTNLHVNNLTF